MDVSGYTAECGAKSTPGVKSKLYLVCACDIDTFPARLATTGVGDTVTLSGNITLKAGKKFAEIDIISETGQIKHTAGGSITSKAFSNSFDFKVMKDIGSDEWFDNHLNGCFVGIVVEKDGSKRVFGEPDMPARIEAAEGSTGDDVSSEKSWIAQILDKTGRVAPYYTGTIDLTA
jgi:hypothetical protein